MTTIIKRPRRTYTLPVRLTEDERERARKLADLYGGTVADVMRAGIDALEREQREQAHKAREEQDAWLAPKGLDGK